MKMNRNGSRKNSGIYFLLPIILFFSIIGFVVFSVAQKISEEMSQSAIQNLSESLDLIKCTIESILKNEAEFQTMIAHEAAMSEDPETYIQTYEKNQTMVKLSLILSGKTEGISHTGEKFSEEGLEFSPERTINGLPVSRSYVNYMGTWAYTIKCPVIKENQEIAYLYVEYVYDTLDKSLPNGFYNQQAMLYIMDAESERFVLKPKGMGKRSAGHINLEDFYRANDILDEGLRAKVTNCLENGDNILFFHDIRDVDALNYMWSVNEGTLYLIGYVPIEAIQQEGKAVNQNIFIVVLSMLIAFFLCCSFYYFSQRQQMKLRKEQEAEREIYNKQLSEALQAAQVASNSKTMFLSNMSHDIRTPMNAVLGFTSLLSMDAENPAKVREYTKKIMASGQHLLSLINDILDISKIESGKVVLSFEPFTLNSLISSVDAIIQPMAKAKRQVFHVEVTGVKHEYLMGDETRINQVLMNLLSNAVKYTQEGGDIWFRIIGLKQHSNQYEHIRIEVEDNGYGMTPEYLKTIFDAFTRAENSTTNKVQGTGLGMAITKNIVELMGGTIEVFSEVNKGSLFRVELELRIPEEQLDKQFWKDSGITRILAVSSETAVCQTVQELMHELNVQVDTVSNIEDASRLTQDNNNSENKYHIVLLDYSILELEMQAAKKWRKTIPQIPFLFLADHNSEGLEEALQIENIGVLTKPFFASAFKEKILEMQKVLKGESQEEAVKSNILEGMHLLAAEDNEINAEILEEILKIEGVFCEIVENGQLVLERFENAAEGEFDAILMDVQMPVMNGYEATKAIRALSRKDAAKIPIIAMTANAFAEDEKAALDAGMNAHIPKPIDIDMLRRIISQYSKRKELQNEKTKDQQA